MSPNTNSNPNYSPSSSPDLPDDLVEQLSNLDEFEIRDVISYAKSLLPATPTVEDLLEEREDEEILEVTEKTGYTKVIKKQPCAEGCDECPHGPYLYQVRVERYPENEAQPSLHWEFIGPVK